MPVADQIRIELLNLVAFLAVLITICVLSVSSHTTPVDLAIMTGLIGVLGTFRPRSNGQDPQTTKAATAAGVSEALDRKEPIDVRPVGAPKPLAADGEYRDWLDEPTASPAPAQTSVAPGQTPVLGD